MLVKSCSSLFLPKCACPSLASVTCPVMRTFPYALPHTPQGHKPRRSLRPTSLNSTALPLHAARIASDYEQRFETRERGDDLLNHSVREVFLFGVAAHVLERQHGDGGLVWEWRGRT